MDQDTQARSTRWASYVRRLLPFLFLVLNVACAWTVLNAAHHVAAVMAREQRTQSDGVDAITFYTMSAPALLVALLANVAWAGKAVVDATRRREYRSFAWLGAAVAVWVLAILVARQV